MADRKVIIIGSGPAGLTAALYTARGEPEAAARRGYRGGRTVDVDDAGGELARVPGRNMGPDLMTEMRVQAELFRHGGPDRERRARRFSGIARSRFAFADGKTITTDALIIATGASARWLEIGCDRKLSGHGVSTCATCDGYFFRGKPIAVVGGGDSAMEEAIYLTRFASKVTVVHRRDSLRASKIMQDKAFANPKNRVHLGFRDRDIKDVKRGEVTGMCRAQFEER
jgi:thioredoxin reductase (NADPH)